MNPNPKRPDWRASLELARAAPRCGARTRSGAPCRQAKVAGRPRCRMHGCGTGSGAPSGKRNGAWRHGRRSRAAVVERRRFRSDLRALKALLDLIG
jgi:glucans biosynthesis protein